MERSYKRQRSHGKFFLVYNEFVDREHDTQNEDQKKEEVTTSSSTKPDEVIIMTEMIRQSTDPHETLSQISSQQLPGMEEHTASIATDTQEEDAIVHAPAAMLKNSFTPSIEGQPQSSFVQRSLRGIRERLFPHKVEEVQQEVTAILSQIDYEQLISYYIRMHSNGDVKPPVDLLYDLAFVRDIEIQLQNPESLKRIPSYMLKSVHTRIGKFHKDMEGYGLLHPPDQQYALRPQTESDDEYQVLIDGTKQLEEQVNGYKALKSIYGPGRIQHRSEQEFAALLSLTSFLQMLKEHRRPQIESTRNAKQLPDIDPHLLQAATRSLDKIQEDLIIQGILPQNEQQRQEYLASFWHTSIEEAIGRIAIGGLEPHDDEQLLIDQTTLMQHIIAAFPVAFLRGIHGIYFTNPPDALVKYATSMGKDATVGGQYNPLTDASGQYSQGDLYIYTSPIDSGDSEDNAIQRYRIFSDIYHEGAHNVHTLLTYDEMRQWEEVMEQDETAVSWYAMKIKEEDPTADGKREDFTETYDLFIYDPYLLELLSPTRYQYMYNLILDYTPPQLKGALQTLIETKKANVKKSIQQKGMDDATFRKFYLDLYA